MPSPSAFEPYHPDPGKRRDMEDVVETASPELLTQEFEAALATGVLPEFVTVTRTKATHWVKFPTAFFEKNNNLPFMSKWVMGVLEKVASIRPKSFSVVTLPSASPEDKPMEYIIFQVYSAHEASVACEHGGKPKNSVDPVLFSLFTPEAKALQQGRVIKLTSLGFDTTANHVTAALSKYGPIESVRTGFNAKATMVTATVTFQSDLAVQSIKEQQKTCLRVRDDVGTLTLVGNEPPVAYDRELTLKLAHLPIGCQPGDVKDVFDHDIKTPNGVRPYHSIAMPLNPYNRQRQPEAYIRFSSIEQRALVMNKTIDINGHKTCWVPANKPTCRHCGDPKHFKKDCIVLQDTLNNRATRRVNVALIKGLSPTPQKWSRTPLTQVPYTSTPTPPAKSATTARSTPSNSYASVAGARNRGGAASDPITISTSTPPTTTPAPSKNATVIPNTTAAAPPSDWKARFKDLSDRMTEMSGRLDKEIRELNGRMLNIEHQLKLILKAITTPPAPAAMNSNTPIVSSFATSHTVLSDSSVGELTDDVDMDLPDVARNQDFVPSTPPSVSPSTPKEQTLSPDTPLVRHRHAAPSSAVGPYSVAAARTHLTGGTSISKNDPQRANSGNSVREELTHKGKAIQKREDANFCTTENIDIIGVQETKINAKKNKEPHLLRRDSACPYTGIWNHTATHFHGKGVGLMIHKAWARHIVETFSDDNGRGIGVVFGFKNNCRVAVINCYFPPSGSNTEDVDFPLLYKWVKHHVDRMRNAGNRILLLGDFNRVVSPLIDRATDNHTSTTPQLGLFPWLSSGRFVDTFRFLHPTERAYTFKTTSRIDMVWASPGLASFLVRSAIIPRDTLTRSDHSVMLASFDLHTLIHPISQATLTTQRAKGKKLLLDKVDDEAWDAFTTQADNALRNHSQLLEAPALDQFPTAYGHGPEATVFSRDYLQTFPLDRAWLALRGAIMDSAYAHLPSVKTGGMPPPPDGEGRIRVLIADLGNIIRATREMFESDAAVDEDLQKTTHRQLRRWHGQNGAEMGINPVPEVNGSAEEWRKWREEVQIHWRQARLNHQNYIAANKQDIINAHIENRDQRFATDTKKTIRNILEVFDGRVTLDHLIIDGTDGPYVEDDPAEIKREDN
ncbi:MAG: hypothetical protein JOS17DRAFT_781663 [Linnemannia elongata]|nr:MAG: hypothetical protein JOS17DRAFT_781663 [Linnemannia elongata]